MAHHHVDFVQMNSKPALYDAAGLLAACPDAVLAVDLDGTLVPGDMLRRGLVQLLLARALVVGAVGCGLGARGASRP